ncbi:MAG: hypothetical protein KF916_06660 [Microbacteriaceae bacterium]|nr:hypothetical protein [Microbacteriaceae bacterium]
MPIESNEPNNSLEKSLASLAIILVVCSLASFVAIIVSHMNGLNNVDYGEGIWPVIVIFPYLSLPVAFLLIISMMFVAAAKRKRAATDQIER